MNKFIKHDIENAISLLKIAINNALSDIESGEEDEINLGDYVPFSLVRQCVEDRGYLCDNNKSFDTNGWDCDCWYYVIDPKNEKHICIQGNLWYGTLKIWIVEDYDN